MPVCSQRRSVSQRSTAQRSAHNDNINDPISHGDVAPPPCTGGCLLRCLPGRDTPWWAVVDAGIVVGCGPLLRLLRSAWAGVLARARSGTWVTYILMVFDSILFCIKYIVFKASLNRRALSSHTETPSRPTTRFFSRKFRENSISYTRKNETKIPLVSNENLICP